MSHFFKYPINYEYNRNAFNAGVSPRVVDNNCNDNRYDTFTRNTNLIFQTHGNTPSTGTPITHVFLKSKNVASYSVTVVPTKGTGTGVISRSIPSNQIVNGFQHDLFPIGPLDATEVNLVVTGSGSQIYEMMLLNSLLELEVNYTDVRLERVSEGDTIRRNIRGNSFRVGSLADRRKWNGSFEAIFLPTSATNGDTFMNALEDGDNFAFAEDFNRWPDRVYPAYLRSDISIDYLGRSYDQRSISFTLAEA